MPEARVFEAITSFIVGATVVRKGDTVREGHPLMNGREANFRPFRVKFDLLEDTSAAPGTRRSSRSSGRARRTTEETAPEPVREPEFVPPLEDDDETVDDDTGEQPIPDEDE